MQPFVGLLPAAGEHAAAVADYAAAGTDPLAQIEALRQATADLVGQHRNAAAGIVGSSGFHQHRLLGFAELARVLSGQLDQSSRATLRLLDLAEKQLAAKDDAQWPTRDIGRARKALDVARGVAVQRLQQVRHFQRHAAWLIERFPDARYGDVQGLCKAVTRADIEAADWSLTPGRYVGVAAVAEDEDFDFVATLTEIHAELFELDAQAQQLSARIQTALAGLLA